MLLDDHFVLAQNCYLEKMVKLEMWGGTKSGRSLDDLNLVSQQPQRFSLADVLGSIQIMGQKAEVVPTTSAHWEVHHRRPRFLLPAEKEDLVVAPGLLSHRVAAGQQPKQQVKESCF